MTSRTWRYGAAMHWNRPDLTMMERIDRRTGLIGAKVYINTPDWKQRLHVNIPCVFKSFDDLDQIGQAFADAALDLQLQEHGGRYPSRRARAGRRRAR